MADVVERIRRQRVLPILRSPTAARAVEAATALAAAGAEVVELTHSTPAVLSAVRELASRGMRVGLGTVTTAGEVAPAAEAGAAFVVSFAHPSGFVAEAHRCGLPAIPGALTPHEVHEAVVAGADAVKLFPARAITPAHVRDLRTVMPAVRLLVTGGIPADPAAVAEWLDAGACAVGLGGALAEAGGPEAVRSRFRALAAGPPRPQDST
jgi:2-dehydro-3-deoxyphosphogluconate aldolase/(4S)-4-hydroxy-2-oxoglutarate aldolase